MGLRGDAILQLDYAVGRLVHPLDSLQLMDKTMIVFNSDNGPVVNDGYLDQSVELLGDHKPAGPLRGGKYSIFEGGTRVPFIVKWPGNVKPGTKTYALISQVDIFASLNALAGQSLKEEDALDSYNLLNALLGKDKKGRDYVIEHSGGFAITKADWKYIVPNNRIAYDKYTNIETGNDPVTQLYNLKNDIGEKNNLAKKYPAIVKELAGLIEQSKGNMRTKNNLYGKYSIPKKILNASLALLPKLKAQSRNPANKSISDRLVCIPPHLLSLCENYFFRLIVLNFGKANCHPTPILVQKSAQLGVFAKKKPAPNFCTLANLRCGRTFSNTPSKISIKQNIPLIDNVVNFQLLQFANPKSVAASEIYIQQGKVFKKIFFIKKGILRSYYVTESGKEKTIFFRWEGQMAAVPQMYF